MSNSKIGDLHEIKKWQSEVLSNSTREKGRQYYEDDLVALKDITKYINGLQFHSVVTNHYCSNNYKVEISCDSNYNLTDYNCNCPAFEQYGGMCKHCVAAVLDYNRYAKGYVERDDDLGDSSDTPDNTFESDSSIAARINAIKSHTPISTADKLAIRRAGNLLMDYKGLALDDIINYEETDFQTRTVTLVPVMSLSNISDGIELSFQIRRRSQSEIDADKSTELNQDDSVKTQKPCCVETAKYPRAYVIKNITSFLQSLSLNDTLNFGKELSFVARDEVFDDAGLRWISFLNRYYTSCVRRYSRYYGSGEVREITLSDAALNEVYNNFSDCLFKTDIADRLYRMIICHENPDLVLRIGQDEKGCVTVKCDDTDNILIPNRNYLRQMDYAPEYDANINGYIERQRKTLFVGKTYLVKNGCLYRYEAEASRVLQPLIYALSDTHGVLEFSPDQTDDLFKHTLCEASRFITIDDPEGLMKKYGTAEMKGRILLDAPNKDTVSAVLLAGYDKVLIDMYSGKPVAVTAQEDVNPDSIKAYINWNVSDLPADKINRNIHAERRLATRACQIMGGEKSDIQMMLQSDETGNIKAGSTSQPITVTGNDRIYDFLTKGAVKLTQLGEVLVTDKMRRLTAAPPKKMTLGVTLDSGLLKVNFDSGDLHLDELRELMHAYREKRRYFRMKSGAFVSISDIGRDMIDSINEFDRIQQGLQLDEKDMDTGTVEVPAFRAMYLDGIFNDYASLNNKRDKAFGELTRRVKEYAHDDYALPKSLENVLRSYQKTGYKWMRCLESCSFCGILADDMGLGKTVQLIAVLVEHYASGDAEKPTLIACPSSLVLNWRCELEKFAPSLPVKIVQGTASARNALISDIQTRDIVITSYDSLKRDLDAYKDVEFHYFVIDEAQYIKNHSTQAAKSVKGIVCAQRFALTGTPIENRLSELWSIFDFLMPGYLFGYSRFKEKFELPITRDSDEVAKANLRGMIMPFVLRRLKSEVLSELPPKTTTVVPVEMNKKHMEAYNAMLLTGLQSLKSDIKRPEGVAKMQVLALLTKLRRLCCDPSLCFESFKYESSKLEACMEILNQAREGGHRVLLFSQYTDMLDILQKRIIRENMSFLRLQGSTPVKDRLSIVDEFNKGETDVFLISLKAGGTGLNLTAADTVIHYDPWWNLAAQDQATDRAHRIGQQKKVQVYKLIAQNSIEEKILKLQEMKKDLASIVETGENDDENSLLTMTADEIVELLQNR